VEDLINAEDSFNAKESIPTDNSFNEGDLSIEDLPADEHNTDHLADCPYGSFFTGFGSLKCKSLSIFHAKMLDSFPPFWKWQQHTLLLHVGSQSALLSHRNPK